MADTAVAAPAIPRPDQDLLCEASDRLNNAAFDLLCAMSANGQIEWDMQTIGSLLDSAESILKKANIPACFPWEDEDGNICYSNPDRCAYCKR